MHAYVRNSLWPLSAIILRRQDSCVHNSSYYNAAVNVNLVYNKPQGKGKYDRKVELMIFEKVYTLNSAI